MPEIKNTFLKSRMNKDTEARILPQGEYRDAQNASVSASEDASVGSLENIRGNKLLTDLGLTDFNIEIIGQYADVVNNRIFFFLSNPSRGLIPFSNSIIFTEARLISSSFRRQSPCNS